MRAHSLDAGGTRGGTTPSLSATMNTRSHHTHTHSLRTSTKIHGSFFAVPWPVLWMAAIVATTCGMQCVCVCVCVCARTRARACAYVCVCVCMCVTDETSIQVNLLCSPYLILCVCGGGGGGGGGGGDQAVPLAISFGTSMGKPSMLIMDYSHHYTCIHAV